MNASLAMHSIAHHDFLKETDILGMCMGERKKKWKNGRKLWRQTVHGCTCAGYLSLSLLLSFVLFFLFYAFSAHPSSYIIVPTLHSFFGFLLFHTFIVHSDRVPMHFRYQVIYFITLMHLKNKRVK